MKMRQQPSSTPRYRREGAFSGDKRPRQHEHGPLRGRSLIPGKSSNFLDRLTATKLLQIIGQPPVNIALWDGSKVPEGDEDVLATLLFHDRASLYLTLLRPELRWGDLFSEGRVEVKGDLPGLLDAVYRGIDQKTVRPSLKWLNQTLGHRRIRNTFSKAADNIHHHYDIGNDFYRLWLDQEALQYTCAYFPDPAMTLEQAQLAKMSHVCRKLQLKPGDQVVEAGCGWGGFALFMAKNHGVSVKAYNISREQVSYANQKARGLGLADRVEYVLDDYRNIRGEHDVFVSIGMLEHVGPTYYPLLGEVIDNCLKPGGRGLIHSIGRNTPKPMNAWIERRIFPGAYPPTLREMMDIFETSRFSVLDVENLRLHYALTLDAWLQRFESHANEVEEMMDEQFVRSWRLYLAGSKAAFTSGRLQLFQVLFSREEDNDIPWSRAYQYNTPEQHHDEIGPG